MTSFFNDHFGWCFKKRRLKNSILSYKTKSTILLKIMATNFDCRRSLLHSGLKDTINDMTFNFWVMQGKRVVTNNRENHLVFYL